MISAHSDPVSRAQVSNIVQSLGCIVQRHIPGGEGYMLHLVDPERRLVFQVFSRSGFSLDDSSVCSVLP